MKLKTLRSGFILSALLFAISLPAYSQSAQHKKLKKRANLALNITNKKEQPPTHVLQHRLCKQLPQPVRNGHQRNLQYHPLPLQRISTGTGLVNITGIHAEGVQLSGIANVTGRNSNGVVLSGLMNVNGGSLNGIALSGIGNMTGKNTHGLIIGGLINIANGQSGGMLLSGIANVSKQAQNGVMISGLMNASGDTVRGLQLTSLLNAAGEANNGVQLAALGNINTLNRGLQLGICNFSAKNKGAQIGITNLSGEGKKGLQFGFVNLSADSLARQIGCINITPRTQIQLLISSGNLNKANLAVRFKNRYTYTELGGGAYYFDLDHDVSASAFYRAGIYYPLLSRLEISADAGFYHIETLDNKHKGYPARAYALQPRLNLEFRITKKLGIFASGGYAWTRPYSKGHTLDHKGTFEAGIVLF